jgi:TRAP-type C4-dicarboxylate transport system permease large subunit
MIAAMDLTPMQTLFVIIGFYFILGFFIETLSLMIITIPIVAPLMIQLGFDPVWFGIVLIVLIEMALITPPVGLNLFVVQSVRQRGTLMDVVVGAIPFVIAMFVMVLLLVAFPQIALLLPQMTTG